MEFGPPPSPSAGRYNRTGQAALYLSKDSIGLSAEMALYAKAGEHFYYAHYHPSCAWWLVDLSDPSAHAALHLAFDRAERLDVDYEASQRLADVVRELEIDGIIVPGVRGKKDHHYSNVVVFNCLDWADWIDTNLVPKLLPATESGGTS